MERLQEVGEHLSLRITLLCHVYMCLKTNVETAEYFATGHSYQTYLLCQTLQQFLD